jgi:tetratricopeptide (TPR) repeat protein
MRWLIPFCIAACLSAYDQPALSQAAPGPPAGSDRQALVNHLLDALKAAPTEEEAAPLEAQITQLWLNAGTPAVMLLMQRGLREMKADTPQDALDDLGAAITLEPDYAEAYHQRAIARFAAGDTAGAIADLHETLARQPRDFAAFRTLAEIAASREDWKSAYAAWQQLMQVDPKTPGGEEKLKDLRRRALGEET